MKKTLLGAGLLVLFALMITSFEKEKHCVYRTMMNEDPVDVTPIFVNIESVNKAVDRGLEWLKNAQHKNGGWGCGFHASQDVRDPHAVPADPATTAMVTMALLRSGSTLDDGPYHNELRRGTEYLLKVLEQHNPNSSNITNLHGTQIQRKLGQNIDVVLTTQYLTNLIGELEEDDPRIERIQTLLQKAVDQIQVAQNENGSLSGGTWAGVLQSSFANSALESAEVVGMRVSEDVIESSRQYQKGNYDLEKDEVSTADGAGILLYSVSSTARANAKVARKAEKKVKEAFKSGAIRTEEVNVMNLMNAGMAESEAMDLNASYQVYQAAKVKAQRDDVLTGFGNNGGEEFLSFLQTGESLIVNEDDTWTNWYDNVSKKMLEIQNNDGSWNGHHCITSPVFCTATSISILTIQNDIEKLKEIGETGDDD